MSGRGLLQISPCRSSLQQNSCVHQTCSHQGPAFPGKECTTFPCSRDLPEMDLLLSFVVIINESDWSSFTSLQVYLRWRFPSRMPEGCLCPRSAAGRKRCLPTTLCLPVPTSTQVLLLPGCCWAVRCLCTPLVHTCTLAECVFNSGADLLSSWAAAGLQGCPLVSSHGACL